MGDKEQQPGLSPRSKSGLRLVHCWLERLALALMPSATRVSGGDILVLWLSKRIGPKGNTFVAPYIRVTQPSHIYIRVQG